MKSLILSKFSLTYLPIIACCLFVVLFVGVIFWVNRPLSKKIYDRLERLPLEEGEKYE